MNTPKISVIVPVYNVEQYLPRCIDSILDQTFTDFELLLIDDGSKDKSGEICDNYAKKDSRIRVFHKENGGVSSARNLGLYNAKGKYIAFIDADDWVENEYLRIMYKHGEEECADIISSDFFLDNTEIQSLYIKQDYNNNRINIIRDLLQNKLGGYLWNKLVKRELYITNKFYFPEDIGIWEDLLILIQLFLAATQTYYLPNAYYHYVRYNTSSAMSNCAEEKIHQKIQVCNMLEELLLKHKILPICISNLHIRQLIAKMEYATDLNLHNYKKWNSLFRDSYLGIWHLQYPLWMKIQLWLIQHHFYLIANLTLYIKLLIKK